VKVNCGKYCNSSATTCSDRWQTGVAVVYCYPQANAVTLVSVCCMPGANGTRKRSYFMTNWNLEWGLSTGIWFFFCLCSFNYFRNFQIASVFFFFHGICHPCVLLSQHYSNHVFVNVTAVFLQIISLFTLLSQNSSSRFSVLLPHHRRSHRCTCFVTTTHWILLFFSLFLWS
jgi:hypothetical protein